MLKALVAGAGGFIGGHLVKHLLRQGVRVTATDIKGIQDWYQLHEAADNWGMKDLASKAVAYHAVEDVDTVFNLAADMGGMGFIENNKALCMLSVLTNTHLLMASRDTGVEKFFFSSSACVYNATKQIHTEVTALKEGDAYPADAEDGYGWEKLFSERMCRHFSEDFKLPTRVARFHNVYGPHGTYKGGREKAPAALCRKVIEAKQSGTNTVEIWGDGKQTRSFMYIDDCLKGIDLITAGKSSAPVNLGSAELVSINDLLTIVEDISGMKVFRSYDPDAPQGVRGRNSDNAMINQVYGWEPSIPLLEGMEQTYAWIYNQMKI